MAGPTSRYRAGNNNLLTKGLFFETTLADKSTVVYSLKDWDHEYQGQVYPSLKRLYMDADDPTEWSFVQKHLDCWDQWELLCECSWFKPYVLKWRKELDLRMKSKSLARIMTEAKTSSKESFNANKYLLEKGWEPKSAARGRPSKEEIKHQAAEIVRLDTRLTNDLKRLGIN